jgi:hypothetical protein
VSKLGNLLTDANISGRAKYIEGLENRLGRMEHLLRLSGAQLLS